MRSLSNVVEKNGKTVRENNCELKHHIPIGSLVEVDFGRENHNLSTQGIRLYVVSHHRDCDGSPLYGLGKKGESNKYKMIFNGYSEDCLRVIKNPDGIDGEMEKKLTFGDLSIGDIFIGFPVPGDNSGHGGYCGEHYLMRKTKLGYNIGESEPIENAESVNRGGFSSIPNSMEVVKIVKI